MCDIWYGCHGLNSRDIGRSLIGGRRQWRSLRLGRRLAAAAVRSCRIILGIIGGCRGGRGGSRRTVTDR